MERSLGTIALQGETGAWHGQKITSHAFNKFYKIAFFFFIQSYVQYCIVAWGSPDTKGLGKINEVITKCIKGGVKETSFCTKTDLYLKIHKYSYHKSIYF